MSIQGQGASHSAIAFHYDIDSEFYKLWLDETMTYSCGMWTDGDTLEVAQIRKLDFHARQLGCPAVSRVLDIGCGWGALPRRLIDVHGVRRVVGLTLSKGQESWIEREPNAQIEIRLESWEDHETSDPYDAIVSVGALEHFVRPSLQSHERVDVYREFFQKCRSLLRPNGRLSLQTSAYARGAFMSGAIASIFPESDLPRLSQLVTAAEGVLELVRVRNDREDYGRTCEAWLRRLRARREEAIAIVGEDIVSRYESFLAAAVKGFDLEVFHLLRLVFRNRA